MGLGIRGAKGEFSRNRLAVAEAGAGEFHVGISFEISWGL
jgi:hypothetical protein